MRRLASTVAVLATISALLPLQMQLSYLGGFNSDEEGHLWVISA
jgi:hypothetical protein